MGAAVGTAVDKVFKALATHIGFVGKEPEGWAETQSVHSVNPDLKGKAEIVWYLKLLPQFAQIAPNGDSVTFSCVTDPGQSRRSAKLTDRQSKVLVALLEAGWDEEIIFPTHMYDTGAIAAIIVDPGKLGILFRLYLERESDGSKRQA